MTESGSNAPFDVAYARSIQKANLALSQPAELYGVALYVALNNIFGGSSEINPQVRALRLHHHLATPPPPPPPPPPRPRPQNYAEHYAGADDARLDIWAYIIGSACGSSRRSTPT